MNKLEENLVDYNNLNASDLKKFENIYNVNQNKFSELIDNLASYYARDLSWLTQSILSKNKSLSTIYFEYCRLEILKKKFKKNFINKIIVENEVQKKLIENNFKYRFKIRFIIKNQTTNSYIKILRNFIFNLKFIFILFINRSPKRKNFFLKKDNITIVENFLYLRKYEKKEYSDRYYGNLLSLLKDKKKSNIFFLFQVLSLAKLRQQLTLIKKYKIKFITIFDFLKLSDYINALIKIHQIKKIGSKKIIYNNIDLSDLFKAEYKKTFNDINVLYGMLQFLFFKRLKKETKQNNIRHIVDWYENQSIDKGFNLGINIFFPKVQTIGYQAYAVDYNYYSHLLPSKGEIINKITPKKIAFIGKEIKSYATKKFKLKKKNLILAPSLRFNNIFVSKSHTKKKLKEKNILLALPVTYNDSEDIVCLLNSYIKKYKNLNHKFYINHHPMLNFEKLHKTHSFISKKFIISKKSFNNSFQKFDCVVSNSSSICFESLAHGIPVIIVKSKTRITHNPIANVKHTIWKLAQNENELKKALDYFLTNKKRSYTKISNIIKKGYFSAVNTKNVHKLLDIK